MLDDLMRMYKELYPPLYYVLQEGVGRGKVYHAKETKLTPECIICHPDDLAKIWTMGRSLVRLRKWKGKQIEFYKVPTSDPEPIKTTFYDG